MKFRVPFAAEVFRCYRHPNVRFVDSDIGRLPVIYRLCWQTPFGLSRLDTSHSKHE